MMQDAKEKVKDMVSSAKVHLDIYKAKAEEKMEVASARTEAEKEMAHQRKAAKVHEAKMHLHEEKLQHKAESEAAKHGGVLHAGVHPPITAGTHSTMDPYAAPANAPYVTRATPTTATAQTHTGATLPGTAAPYGSGATTTTTEPHAGYATTDYPLAGMTPTTTAKRM